MIQKRNTAEQNFILYIIHSDYVQLLFPLFMLSLENILIH